MKTVFIGVTKTVKQEEYSNFPHSFGAKKRHSKATVSVKTCEVLIILLIENCLACYADRSWVHYADTKSAAGFCSIFVVNKGA